MIQMMNGYSKKKKKKERETDFMWLMVSHG